MGRGLPHILPLLVASRQLPVWEMFPSLHKGQETPDAEPEPGCCSQRGGGACDTDNWTTVVDKGGSNLSVSLFQPRGPNLILFHFRLILPKNLSLSRGMTVTEVPSHLIGWWETTSQNTRAKPGTCTEVPIRFCGDGNCKEKCQGSTSERSHLFSFFWPQIRVAKRSRCQSCALF